MQLTEGESGSLQKFARRISREVCIVQRFSHRFQGIASPFSLPFPHPPKSEPRRKGSPCVFFYSLSFCLVCEKNEGKIARKAEDDRAINARTRADTQRSTCSYGLCVSCTAAWHVNCCASPPWRTLGPCVSTFSLAVLHISTGVRVCPLRHTSTPTLFFLRILVPHVQLIIKHKTVLRRPKLTHSGHGSVPTRTGTECEEHRFRLGKGRCFVDVCCQHSLSKVGDATPLSLPPTKKKRIPLLRFLVPTRRTHGHPDEPPASAPWRALVCFAAAATAAQRGSWRICSCRTGPR